MKLTCASCGKPFLVSASRALTRRYCSHTCASAGFVKAKPGTAMRRYCPACKAFRIAPGAELCECGARPSRDYPTYVPYDLEPEEVLTRG